jgi:hypothetical protein
MISRDRTSPRIDFNFLGTALVLAMIGCLLVYSATYFNEPGLGTFKRQIIWVAIGLALAIIIMMIDYHILFDIAPIVYGIGIILLLYLLVWGKVTANVKSWVHIGGFQFQPSEFMKVFTALMLARFFDSNDRAYLDLRSFMIAMGIIGLPVGLIIIQPDFGTAASFFPLIAVAMFFGGIRPRIWIAMILIAAIALPLGWGFFLKPYQKERVMIFLNPARSARVRLPGHAGQDRHRLRRHSRQGLPPRHAGQIRIRPRTSHRFHLLRPRRGMGLRRRDRRARALSLLCVSGADVRETCEGPGRHIPRDLPDDVLRVPRPDQRLDADRHPSDDRHPAAADLVRRLVDDDVLHGRRVDRERRYETVRELVISAATSRCRAGRVSSVVRRRARGW